METKDKILLQYLPKALIEFIIIPYSEPNYRQRFKPKKIKTCYYRTKDEILLRHLPKDVVSLIYE